MADILSFEKAKQKRTQKPPAESKAREVVIMPEIDMDAVRTAWANIDKIGKTHTPLRVKKSPKKT